MKTTSIRLSLGPQTKAGLWSIWLAVGFVLMFGINIPVNIYLMGPPPFPAYYVAFILFMLACGIIAGVLGLIAVTRQHERSPFIWISTLAGLFALLILMNELMQGLQYILTQ